MSNSHKSSGQKLKNNQYSFIASPKNIDILRILDETPQEKKVVITDTFLRHDNHIPEKHCRFMFIRATSFTRDLINIESPIIDKFLDLFTLDENYPEFYWIEVPVYVTDEQLQEIGGTLSELISYNRKFKTIVSLY